MIKNTIELIQTAVKDFENTGMPVLVIAVPKLKRIGQYKRILERANENNGVYVIPFREVEHELLLVRNVPQAGDTLDLLEEHEDLAMRHLTYEKFEEFQTMLEMIVED